MPAHPRHPGPPRPPLRLTVGVTGHRDLGPAERATVEAEGARVLHALRRGWPAGDPAYADAPPELVLVSQLAEGADQVLARAGLEAGATLAAMLPFARMDYLESLPPPARAEFVELEARAASVWVGHGDDHGRERGYELAAGYMLAQSDVLLAVWDGQPGRGPGGTAAVVHQAVRQGVPVLHLHSDGGSARLIWSGFADQSPGRLDPRSAPSRPGDDAALEALAATLLAPPTAPDQRAALLAFLDERERRLRLRLEYPLLLALTGIRALRRAHVLVAPYREAAARDWSPFDDALAALFGADGAAEPSILQEAFGWSDRLGDHYAQTYRSGTVLNYAAAAGGVLAALAGLLAPDAKPWLLAAELVSITALVFNTTVGNRRQWHRRWLDYRFLAEQLRPIRSLRMVGAVRPEMRARGGVDPPWTEWYVAAIWRACPPPPSPPAGDFAATMAGCIAAHELDPQVAYHRANAARMLRLDHRLHRAGTALFMASLGCSLVGLVGFLAHLEVVHAHEALFTVLGAGLPTAGSALFGIRGQNDFAGVARRSLATGRRLELLAERLRSKPMNLHIAARLTEDAASAMAADLGEWRGAFIDRKLAIPA